MAKDQYPTPDQLRALMTEDSLLGSGTSSVAYALPGDELVLRVAKDHQGIWGAHNPPELHMLPKQLVPNAGVRLAEYHALDPETGRSVVVADVQRRVKGHLLELTRQERKACKKIITHTRTPGEKVDVGGFIMTFAGGETYEEEVLLPDVIDAANARMIALARDIIAMPDDFFTQAIHDVAAIQEAGYGLDPSKSGNFYLIPEQRRLGFVDLMPGKERRVPPNEIAAILRGPARAIQDNGSTTVARVLHGEMGGRITARVIRACDQLGIAFAPDYSAYPTMSNSLKEYEADIRATWGEEYGITTAPANIRPIMLRQVPGYVLPCGHAPK